MYARVFNAMVLEDKMDELLELVNGKLAAAAKEQKGSRGILLLTDVGSRRAISISLWESKEALLESEANGFLENVVAEALPFLEEAPSSRNYRVAGGP